jgi:hypothetical protein
MSECWSPTGTLHLRHGAMPVSRLFVCLAIAIVLSTGLFACRDKGPNTVVAYLQGAERQSEDTDQRREIEKALNDMLTLTPDELRKRRYANYQMEPGAWDIIYLLHRYFVPQKLRGLDETRFYRDVTDPASQAIIRDHLQRVRMRIELDQRDDVENTDGEGAETK